MDTPYSTQHLSSSHAKMELQSLIDDIQRATNDMRALVHKIKALKCEKDIAQKELDIMLRQRDKEIVDNIRSSLLFKWAEARKKDEDEGFWDDEYRM
jgi:hypothetical protein